MTAPRPARLPRYDPGRGPRLVRDLWTLHRERLELRCSLSTHPLGWELKLSSKRAVLRTEMCRHEGDVFVTSDAWRAEASRKGWA